MLRVYKMHIWQNGTTDAHAEHARKELMRMLILIISNFQKRSKSLYSSGHLSQEQKSLNGLSERPLNKTLIDTVSKYVLLYL